jgi:hypothetical protein
VFGDLFAAVSDVLAVSGDPPVVGPHQQVKQLRLQIRQRPFLLDRGEVFRRWFGWRDGHGELLPHSLATGLSQFAG